MGFVSTIRDALAASTQSANRGDGTERESKGAYWCHDCDERIRDVDVAETATPDDPESGEAPDCPSCGDPMEFERSVGTTGCAC